MNVPMIAFRDVWKNYGRLDVLKGIDQIGRAHV